MRNIILLTALIAFFYSCNFNTMRNIILLTALIAFFYSCNSGAKKVETQEPAKDTSTAAKIPARQPKDDFPIGKVIPSVKIKSDSTQSYALYLPAGYDKNKDMPAVFFFEPHARGVVPMNKYKALADKYHYIILCSNTSQNGMTDDQLDPIIDKYMQDGKNRTAIDPQRVYVGGFSGGSMVAGMVALGKGGVKGVIGAGKGLPKAKGPIPAPFNYFGIVGDGDFNYDEMISLDRSFDKSAIKHQLVIFQGKHEWPPLEKMDDAFLWMDLQAMKDKQLAVNNDEIDAFIKMHETAASSYEKAGRNYEAAVEYNELAQSLNGIHDINAWQGKLKDISTKDVYKNEIATLDKLSKSENEERNSLLEAFKTKPTPWWATTIQGLQQQARSTTGPVSAYKRRLVSLISMVSFVQADAALKNNKIPDAAHFIDVFKLADPQNNDVPYLSACLFAAQGNKAAAFSSLKQAIAGGFNDKSRLQSDPAWSSLKGDAEYQSILNRMQ